MKPELFKESRCRHHWINFIVNEEDEFVRLDDCEPGLHGTTAASFTNKLHRTRRVYLAL